VGKIYEPLTFGTKVMLSLFGDEYLWLMLKSIINHAIQTAKRCLSCAAAVKYAAC